MIITAERVKPTLFNQYRVGTSNDISAETTEGHGLNITNTSNSNRPDTNTGNTISVEMSANIPALIRNSVSTQLTYRSTLPINTTLLYLSDKTHLQLLTPTKEKSTLRELQKFMQHAKKCALSLGGKELVFYGPTASGNVNKGSISSKSIGNCPKMTGSNKKKPGRMEMIRKENEQRMYRIKTEKDKQFLKAFLSKYLRSSDEQKKYFLESINLDSYSFLIRKRITLLRIEYYNNIWKYEIRREQPDDHKMVDLYINCLYFLEEMLYNKEEQGTVSEQEKEYVCGIMKEIGFTATLDELFTRDSNTREHHSTSRNNNKNSDKTKSSIKQVNNGSSHTKGSVTSGNDKLDDYPPGKNSQDYFHADSTCATHLNAKNGNSSRTQECSGKESGKTFIKRRESNEKERERKENLTDYENVELKKGQICSKRDRAERKGISSKKDNTECDTSGTEIKVSDMDIYFQLKHAGDKLKRSLNSSSDPRCSFKLDAWQKRTLDLIDQNRNIVISAPTSSGKTFITYYTIYKATLSYNSPKRVLFVVPEKALVNQLAFDIINKFDNLKYGMVLREYSHDEDAAVLLTVPEMVESLIDKFNKQTRDICHGDTSNNCSPSTMPHHGNTSDTTSQSNKMVTNTRAKHVHGNTYMNHRDDSIILIIDEIHKLNSPEMSSFIERAIHKHTGQLICLSATMGEDKRIYKWLKRVMDEKMCYQHNDPTNKGLINCGTLTNTSSIELVQHDERYCELRKYYWTGGSRKMGLISPLVHLRAEDFYSLTDKDNTRMNKEINSHTNTTEDYDMDIPYSLRSITLLPEDVLSLYYAIFTVFKTHKEKKDKREIAQFKRDIKSMKFSNWFTSNIVTKLDVKLYYYDLIRVIINNRIAEEVLEIMNRETNRLFFHSSVGDNVDGTRTNTGNRTITDDTNRDIKVDSTRTNMDNSDNTSNTNPDNNVDSTRTNQLNTSRIPSTTDIVELVEHLKDNNMMPVIIFGMTREQLTALSTQLYEHIVNKQILNERIERKRAEKQRELHKFMTEKSKGSSTTATKTASTKTKSSTLDKDAWIEESLLKDELESVVHLQDDYSLERVSSAEIDCLVSDIKVPPIYKSMLHYGIGVHHKGMNKKYREVVEMMFRGKQLGVVFSSETLALGINMPCRTVVICGDSNRRINKGIVQESSISGKDKNQIIQDDINMELVEDNKQSELVHESSTSGKDKNQIVQEDINKVLVKDKEQSESVTQIKPVQQHSKISMNEYQTDLDRISLIQMSGRAGRRGYDTIGNVVYYGISPHNLIRLNQTVETIEKPYSLNMYAALWFNKLYLKSILIEPFTYLRDMFRISSETGIENLSISTNHGKDTADSTSINHSNGISTSTNHDRIDNDTSTTRTDTNPFNNLFDKFALSLIQTCTSSTTTPDSTLWDIREILQASPIRYQYLNLLSMLQHYGFIQVVQTTTSTGNTSKGTSTGVDGNSSCADQIISKKNIIYSTNTGKDNNTLNIGMSNTLDRLHSYSFKRTTWSDILIRNEQSDCFLLLALLRSGTVTLSKMNKLDIVNLICHFIGVKYVDISVCDPTSDRENIVDRTINTPRITALENTTIFNTDSLLDPLPDYIMDWFTEQHRMYPLRHPFISIPTFLSFNKEGKCDYIYDFYKNGYGSFRKRYSGKSDRMINMVLGGNVTSTVDGDKGDRTSNDRVNSHIDNSARTNMGYSDKAESTRNYDYNGTDTHKHTTSSTDCHTKCAKIYTGLCISESELWRNVDHCVKLLGDLVDILEDEDKRIIREIWENLRVKLKNIAA